MVKGPTSKGQRGKKWEKKKTEGATHVQKRRDGRSIKKGEWPKGGFQQGGMLRMRNKGGAQNLGKDQSREKKKVL